MGDDERANWSQLGDRQYRKQEIATMEWEDMELSIFMVAGAKFGGPVALKRDPAKPLPVGKSAPPSDKIFVYSSSGKKLSEFVPDSMEVMVKMGWTDTEKLVCVHADGNVFAYNIHGGAMLPTSVPNAPTSMIAMLR